MVNYQLGKIYKITSPNTDMVYIGSTTKRLLCQRYGDHVEHYKGWFENERYNWCSSFLILGSGDATIELLEAVPCSSKDELTKRERFYLESTPNCVNMNMPSRTKHEHYLANREKILGKMAEMRRELKSMLE